MPWDVAACDGMSPRCHEIPRHFPILFMASHDRFRADSPWNIPRHAATCLQSLRSAAKRHALSIRLGIGVYLLKHVKSRCASCRTLRRILQNAVIHRRGANSWARSQHMFVRGRRQGKPYIQSFSSLFPLGHCAPGGISREVVRSHGTNHGASHGIPREVSCSISRVFSAA